MCLSSVYLPIICSFLAKKSTFRVIGPNYYRIWAIISRFGGSGGSGRYYQTKIMIYRTSITGITGLSDKIGLLR